MSAEMVLNELSYAAPASSVLAARELMKGLIETIAAAKKAGIQGGLRTHQPLTELELSAGYPFRKWCNDKDVPVDRKRFFFQMITKSPFLDDMASEQQAALNLDFKFNGHQANGFGAAMLLDGLALSFKSDVQWDCCSITFSVEEMDSCGSVSVNDATINHASKPAHVDTLGAWIQGKRQSKFVNGDDCWSRRADLFPHLEFCESVRHSIEPLGANDPHFMQLCKRLSELEDHCAKWNDGGFNPDDMPCKVTPESTKTLKDYLTEHTFTCPNGKDEVFSWHVRMTPGAWRLFFRPDPVTRHYIVGYIGTKLPTVLYP